LSPQSTGQPWSAYCSKSGPAGWSSTSFLGKIRPRTDFICLRNLRWDGVSGVSGVGVCGRCGGDGGAGLQLAVRYGVSTLHGDRGGSLLGFAR
jgi:hypothetical protein